MEKLSKYNILIVNEKADFRDTLAYDFTMIGFTVFPANGIDHAFKILKKHKVDLIISENVLDSSGNSFLDRLAAQFSDFPKLILISDLNLATTTENFAKGVINIISKTFDEVDRQSLVATVFGALNLQKK